MVVSCGFENPVHCPWLVHLLFQMILVLCFGFLLFLSFYNFSWQSIFIVAGFVTGNSFEFPFRWVVFQKVSRFVASKAFSLFEHGVLFFGENIVESLLYDILDMLMIFFFVFTAAVFILDSAFVVFQYGLYVIHVHSIWVFMVVMICLGQAF